MSAEYEFLPALPYAHVIASLPPGIEIVPGYGDVLKDGKARRCYVDDIAHVLLTDGNSSCWLRRMEDGTARVEVYGMQQRRDEGGHLWWWSAFRAHYRIAELWDMCNAQGHPPECGYALEVPNR
jgi:hypothetical protein